MPYSEIGPFELLQARQVIESNITGFAASQISFNELQELKKIIRLQENAIAAESDKFEDLDHRFHSIIAEATQNRVLIKQAAELWRAVRTENPRWKKLNYKYLHEKAFASAMAGRSPGYFPGSATERFRARQGSVLETSGKQQK